MQLREHFKAYHKVKRIMELNMDITLIQADLKKEILSDFESR